MADRGKVVKAFEYLNWYFTQDDGTADKNAVKAWEVLLREQGPVEPIKTPETIRAEYNCGECTASVGIRFYDGDWYFKADYCPHCGRKVLWDAGN